MAVISIGGQTFAAGSSQTVTSVYTDITAITVVGNDSYYSDAANWKSVIFLYDSPSNHSGFKKITLNNNGSNVFTKTYVPFSAKAQVGVWTCSKILLMDYDGEYFDISGSNLPSGLSVTIS